MKLICTYDTNLILFKNKIRWSINEKTYSIEKYFRKGINEILPNMYFRNN